MAAESGRAGPGIAEDCPCALVQCRIHGNCVACVRAHRQHQRHLPECMQPMLRDLIRQMAGKVEYRVEEARPTPAPPAKATGSGQGR